jgi:hypothetical protein
MEQSLKESLASLANVRQQIEALAARHKADEAALAASMFHLLAHGHSPQLVEPFARDRERLLHAFHEFKSQGDAIIHRMHHALQASQDERSALEHRVDELLLSNKRLAAELQARDSLIENYIQLLSDANTLVESLKQETLRLRQDGSTSRETDSSRLASLLRQERSARLQAEEFSSQLMEQHTRSVQLLDQRIELLQASPRKRGSKSSFEHHQESMDDECVLYVMKDLESQLADVAVALGDEFVP